MKKLMVILAVLAGVGATGYLTGNAAGQNNDNAGTQKSASGPTPSKVGVIDLEYVFKNYEKFKQQSERVQEEFKQRRDELSVLDQQIKKLAEEQKQFKPASAEYQKRDNDITRMSADLRAQAEQAQKEFARKDAALLRRNYDDIQKMIELAAHQRHLTVVLQKQSPSSESDGSMGEIRRDLSRFVLYHEPKLDITELVLYNLNLRFKQDVSGVTPPANSRSASRSAPTRSQRR